MFYKVSKSQEAVFGPQWRYIEDLEPRLVEGRYGLLGLRHADFALSMMEFYKQLPHTHSTCDQVRDHTVFRAFHVHLQEVDT